MEEKKTFIINCDICDARKVNEETLAEYEKIIITETSWLWMNGARKL